MRASTAARGVLETVAESYEVAIVGGGPAGSALAAVLAKSGRGVALFERDHLPRDKLCGEFLSGQARGCLAEIGCLDQVLALEPARIRSTLFTTRSGRTFRTDLPEEGLGLSRRALDDVLFRHAAECGAETFQGAEVRGLDSIDAGTSRAVLTIREKGCNGALRARQIEADIVVGAYGRRSFLDRGLKRSYLRSRHPFVGLQRHHRPRAGSVGRRLRAELDGVVEIHAFGGGYCGLSFVEEDRVNVCMLLTSKFLKALPTSEWSGILLALGEANPSLLGRFEALVACNEEQVHAVGGIPFSSKERAAGPALLTGDAAGMVAPFSGGGQAMALSSGVLLARLILAHPVKLTARGFQGLAGRWNRVWQSNFGRQMRLGRWLQGLILSPIAMEVVAGTLTRVPYVARYLVRLTRA